jgi:hypothetical protein
MSTYQLRTGGQILPYKFLKYSAASAFANALMHTKQARRVVIVQSHTGKELSPLTNK